MNDIDTRDLFGNKVITKQPIDRDVLTKQIYSVVKKLSLQDFVLLMTNEFEAVMQYGDLSNGEKSCQKTSLLFNPHRLDTKTKSSKYSIFSAMQNESFVNGLARAVLFKKEKVKELLYQVIQLGVNGVQYVNEFPPHIARDLCVKNGIQADSKVLDPCAGWGGRMIGISVVSNHYDCFEPETRTFSGLENLLSFIKTMNNSFCAKIHNIPFEEALLEDNSYDFAITSPPYYDTEEYSEENTNSLNRYNTFEKWRDLFYLPLIEKTMKALKPNKIFILNIGSRVYPLNDILIRNFKEKHEIRKMDKSLSGSAGLGKSGEGETFYAIKK